jgi:hypothetical protein
VDNIGLNRAYWEALLSNPDDVPTFNEVDESDHSELKKLNENLFLADNPQTRQRTESNPRSQSNPNMLGLRGGGAMNRSAGISSPPSNVIINSQNVSSSASSGPPRSKVSSPNGNALHSLGSGSNLLISSMGSSSNVSTLGSSSPVGKLPNLPKKTLELSWNVASSEKTIDGICETVGLSQSSL